MRAGLFLPFYLPPQRGLSIVYLHIHPFFFSFVLLVISRPSSRSLPYDKRLIRCTLCIRRYIYFLDEWRLSITIYRGLFSGKWEGKGERGDDDDLERPIAIQSRYHVSLCSSTQLSRSLCSPPAARPPAARPPPARPPALSRKVY